MNENIEIEFKNLLTEKEYHLLLQSLPFPKKAKKLVNHYFETESFSLKQKRCALRLREKDGIFIATLKTPHTEGVLEVNDRVTPEEAEHWLNHSVQFKPNIRKKMNQFGILESNLQYYGSLMTYRREIIYEKITLVLDESYYMDKKDYEIELETTNYSYGKKVFKDILKNYTIEKKETPPKIKRFFDALNPS